MLVATVSYDVGLSWDEWKVGADHFAGSGEFIGALPCLTGDGVAAVGLPRFLTMSLMMCTSVPPASWQIALGV